MSVTLWTKFYWSDWLGNTRLRMCSIGARGLWIDMLAVAAQSEPVGYITPPDGRLFRLLSRISGITEAEAFQYFDELAVANVFMVDGEGRLYCPRMVRDNANLQKAISSGQRGGRVSRDKRKGIFKPSEGWDDGVSS